MRLLCCLLAGLSVLQMPQGKPDFAGTWQLVSASESHPDNPEVMLITPSVGRANVHVWRQLKNGSDRSETYAIGIHGGTVGGITVGKVSGWRNHYRVEWEEQVLVIENATSSSSAGGKAWTERREE